MIVIIKLTVGCVSPNNFVHIQGFSSSDAPYPTSILPAKRRRFIFSSWTTIAYNINQQSDVNG
ncbi:hypothetical protein [Anabaena azotica]|uniref:Uncharacterized protein n=1 Tax=Anabaena azotica FACHB-119 TaxID=947527 RepID=A0ABR8D179_9NOST|nr:hypothetical protein [Anabaena azotica]MBD2499941.1 hypothetical protein [Anabaena azotica FACHB-119]